MQGFRLRILVVRAGFVVWKGFISIDGASVLSLSPIAQSAERSAVNRKVVGSSPTGRAFFC